MTGFAIETIEDAPAASREILKSIEAEVGFIPNIYRLFAASPSALEALVALGGAQKQSPFSPPEREIIAIATSVANACPYCVAGHSTFARKLGVDADVIDAARADRGLPDARLEALRAFTRALLTKKGAIDAADMDAFIDGGFEPAHMLDLLVGVAAKIMTNFAAKAARTPLDQTFAAEAWTPPATSASRSVSLA